MNGGKSRIPTRATFKNPNFQFLCELGILRLTFKNPNFESKDEIEKIYVPIWVPLLKIKGIYINSGWSHFNFNVMNEILSSLEFQVFINENGLGKINFLLGKMEFWTHWEFCTYHSIFSLKGPAGYTLSIGFSCFWGFLWPWKLTFSEHGMKCFFVFVSLMT